MYTPDPNARLWVEKYRPRTISAVTHQPAVTATLQSIISSQHRGDLPHLLFYGPPGTGKTSTALALVRELFGPSFRARLLELNASDERGIAVVRDKIKTFAQATVANISGEGAVRLPTYKVIVLDEADAITSDAQTALRRTMERFAMSTRFILICNYVSRIIGPLSSRCAKFRFGAIPHAAMTDHLNRIVEKEDVDVDAATVDALVRTSGGDMRRAINTLQSACRMVGRAKVAVDVVDEVACLVPRAVVETFEQECMRNAATNGEARKSVDAVLDEGYSGLQLLTQVGARLLMGSGAWTAWNDLQKAAVAVVLARAEKALVEGGDELLQLYYVAAQIQKVAGMAEDVDALREVTMPA
eukprot:GFKZ01007185.1.p1 GENE.GFKZ01007185.1~~GFKZ01007185.1.p1  ORF type:complete len:357 (-),score=63.49 GFKZ01007185.1:140-1210(-)